MTGEPFGLRLARAVHERGPLCVGVDPHPGLLGAWSLPDDVRGLQEFALAVVDALGDRVAVLKPQAAFFERHGSAGIAVLERLLAAARDAGALTIADAKRGDIGSTMAAYADAFLRDGSPLAADAMTLSPFLGVGSLGPAFQQARATGRGAFVLALTSNPEGAQVQHARGADGRTVAEMVLDAVRAENAADAVTVEAAAGSAPGGSFGGSLGGSFGGSLGGSFGVVVGATVGEVGRVAPRLDVGGPILAPGIGAQGARPGDLRRVFGGALGHVLPSVSREILAAGARAPGRGRARTEALRDAAGRMLDAVVAALAAAATSD